MDKKIREIMDNLDCEETQELLEEIDVSNMDADSEEGHTLNYDRIAGMVYEKTGVKKKKVINFRKYASMAAVACLGFLIGLATMFIGINIGNNNSRDGYSGQKTNVAQMDEDERKPGSYDESDNTATGVTDNDDKSDKDKDTDSDKKNPSKTDKNTGHKNTDKQPVKDGEIKAGDKNTSDEIESMPYKDIEKILSDATSEIDMGCFVAKYSDIETMVEDCDYVLKGTKVDSRFRLSDKKDEYDLYAEFKVESVLVNNTNKEINEKISVLEGIRYDKKEEKIIHLAGYRCMEMDKDYILFVKEKSDKSYRIAGMVYGKVPVDAGEEVLEVDGVFDDNEHITKLKTMISEARDRFNHADEQKTEEPSNSGSDSEATSEPECDSDSSSDC